MSDRFNELRALLNSAGRPPWEQAAQGVVPTSTVVTLYPEQSHMDADRTDSLNALVSVSAIRQLYATMMSVKKNKGRGQANSNEPKTPSQCLQEFADEALIVPEIMQGPLASYFIDRDMSQEKVALHLRKSELHKAFLEKVFDSVKPGEEALKDLDAILTKIVKELHRFPISADQTTRVRHTICINTVPKLDLEGSEFGPYVPRCTVVFLLIKAGSWKAAIDKSQEEAFDFDMELVVQPYDFNVRAFHEAKRKFDQILQASAEKSMEEYGNLISLKIVDKNQNTARA